MWEMISSTPTPFFTWANTNGPLPRIFFVSRSIRLRDAGPAFARHFVATRNVNDLNREVCQFTAEARGQIVAAGFDEEELRFEFFVKFFEREQVGRNVFANRRMRTAASFHSANSFGGQGTVFRQKLAVFLSENVVRHCRDVHFLTQPFAELKHQGGLPAADWPADANSEGAFLEIAVERQFAIVKMSGVIGMCVRVAVAVVRMKVKK